MECKQIHKNMDGSSETGVAPLLFPFCILDGCQNRKTKEKVAPGKSRFLSPKKTQTETVVSPERQKIYKCANKQTSGVCSDTLCPT